MCKSDESFTQRDHDKRLIGDGLDGDGVAPVNWDFRKKSLLERVNCRTMTLNLTGPALRFFETSRSTAGPARERSRWSPPNESMSQPLSPSRFAFRVSGRIRKNCSSVAGRLPLEGRHTDHAGQKRRSASARWGPTINFRKYFDRPAASRRLRRREQRRSMPISQHFPERSWRIT